MKILVTGAKGFVGKNLCAQLNNIKEGKAKLVLVSTEASDNTKKKFSDKSAYYNVPYFEYGTRSELGLATGKGDRVSIAVLDDGFSNTIIKMLTDNK